MLSLKTESVTNTPGYNLLIYYLTILIVALNNVE
jgi:hypothetical protein